MGKRRERERIEILEVVYKDHIPMAKESNGRLHALSDIDNRGHTIGYILEDGSFADTEEESETRGIGLHSVFVKFKTKDEKIRRRRNRSKSKLHKQNSGGKK